MLLFNGATTLAKARIHSILWNMYHGFYSS